MEKILIVEDEIAIADLLRIGLSEAGYSVDYVLNGRDAADKIEEVDYDLILLDIMLPEIDGYELLEYIHPMGVPVIFITAKGTLKERVYGLKAGADDYIVKPFELDEVIARVETVLRRYGKANQSIIYHDINIDTKTRLVSKNGIEIELTQREYQLFLMMIQNKDILLYRDSLYEKVWEREFVGDSRTLDLHIQRLRKKLGLKDCIKTVYGVGYILKG